MERLLSGLTIEGEEMVEAGSRVVVTGVIRGRPVGVDEDWELPFSHVWEVGRGGRPLRVRPYFYRPRPTPPAPRGGPPPGPRGPLGEGARSPPPRGKPAQ